jgi:hypothetical protein
MPADTLAGAREYHPPWLPSRTAPASQKGPRIPGRQGLDLGPDELSEYFAVGCNVGVILGPPSDELADIDLDCAEALETRLVRNRYQLMLTRRGAPNR